MSALLRAELLKLRSTRTSIGLGIAVLLVSLVPTILLEHHQTLVLHFLVGRKTLPASGAFAPPPDGRALTGGP